MFAGCSAERPQVVTRTEVVRVSIPEHLTQPTPEPECLIEVNGDFVPCIQALREALGMANADKEAIRGMDAVTNQKDKE